MIRREFHQAGWCFITPPNDAITFSRETSGTHTIDLSAFDRDAGIAMISDPWDDTNYIYYIRSYYDDLFEPQNSVVSAWISFDPNMIHVDFRPKTKNEFSKQLWNYGHRTQFPP